MILSGDGGRGTFKFGEGVVEELDAVDEFGPEGEKFFVLRIILERGIDEFELEKRDFISMTTPSDKRMGKRTCVSYSLRSASSCAAILNCFQVFGVE